jgi:histidinol-phosphate phosphatase family protein
MNLDWRRLSAAAEQNGGLGTLLLHRSSHPEDSDLVVHDDADRLIGWLGRSPGRQQAAVVPTAALGNSGVAVLGRALLDRIPTDRPCDLFGEVVPALVDARAPLYAYRSCEYVRDLGTPQRLRSVEEDLLCGRARHRAGLVLLDRDGVLTEEVGGVGRIQDLRLLQGAGQAVRRLNEAGIPVIVVSNQAVVARGACSLAELDAMNAALVRELAKSGARLDGVFVCPHHPETQHDGGEKSLRGPCSCRKPSVGLVTRALESLDVPAWRAVVVGDGTIDMQLASNAGLASIGLTTGLGCADGRFPARPVWRFPDLDAAAAWLSGEPSGSTGPEEL